MFRVSFQNKFEKLVHLVGFIVRKFVAMHGHMNVTMHGHMNVTMYGHMNVTMHGHMNVTMHGHMNVTMHSHMNVKLVYFCMMDAVMFTSVLFET
jgi:hypothetical protein